MSDLWTSVVNLFQSGGTVVAAAAGLVFAWSLAVFAVAWVAFAIDWRKMWPALREGAAIPFVLIAAMCAFVWGFLAPSDADFFGTRVPNFLWQVIATVALLCVMFFCGWLQMRYQWFPPEIELEPAGGHGHGHGDHGHGHHDAHAPVPEDETEDDDGTPAEPPPVPAAGARHGHH